MNKLTSAAAISICLVAQPCSGKPLTPTDGNTISALDGEVFDLMTDQTPQLGAALGNDVALACIARIGNFTNNSLALKRLVPLVHLAASARDPQARDAVASELATQIDAQVRGIDLGLAALDTGHCNEQPAFNAARLPAVRLAGKMRSSLSLIRSRLLAPE